jgi:hypothetical protein
MYFGTPNFSFLKYVISIGWQEKNERWNNNDVINMGYRFDPELEILGSIKLGDSLLYAR